MSDLLDQFGNPIERERVRRALGFVERTVKAEDGDVAHGVTPGRSGQACPGFRDSGNGWWELPTWATGEEQPR